jgi:O-antigen/teichoic acid export membrane protein
MFFFKSIRNNIRTFIARLKTVRKPGSFAQNISFTFSGNLFGIVLSLIFAPIMSRIYPPASYGTFAVYTAIIGNVGAFALLNYNTALLIPKDEEKFNNLLRLTFTLNLIFSAFVFITTILFSNKIIELLNLENLGDLIYLIGPALFLTGTGAILGQWLSRLKEFKKLTIVNSGTNFITRISTISLGYFSNGNIYGFIIGDFIGKALTDLLLFNRQIWIKIKDLISKFKLNEVINTAKEFKKYPLFVLPGEYINMFSGQLPIYLISIYFGNKELGYFAFATSMLGMPMGLLASAVRPVFFQKASSIYNEDKDRLGDITSDLFKYLFVLGIMPFSVLTVFGDVIFAFVFGSQWTQAGLFAGILGYYYIFQLISSPISSILWVLKKEKVFFLFQIFLFLTRLISLSTGIFIFKNLITTLILFSIANTLNYLILTIFILKEIRLNYIRITSITVSVIILIFTFLYLLKYILDKAFIN